jgi:glycosyltransferase involved in cell wall biosynthesis
MHLGILTSHPIQYQAPLFRALAERVDLTVYFAHEATGNDQAEAGFDVSFDWDTDLTSGFRHRFLENISRRPSITRFTGCDTPSIGKVLMADKVDVLAVNGWHLKSYLQAAKAARSLRVPVMVRTDSDLETPRPLVKRALKAIAYPVFFRKYAMFLPAGTRSVQYLRHYGVPESRIRIVPYCIDVERFSSAADRARANRKFVRAEFGAADGEWLVLFAGKLIRRKAIPDLIEALARLSASGKAVRLFVVGSGPLAGELADMANTRRVRTTFVGFVNQSRMPEVYAAADVLVLPSYIDTWGLVVNEAFACGLPAIVSDRVGCAPDMIMDGLTGTIVPAGNVTRLAQAIDHWTGAHDDAAVRRALDEITARYSPASSAAAFVAAAGSIHYKAVP